MGYIKFTYSTGCFYTKRTEKGKVQHVKKSSLSKSDIDKAMKNAGVWVKR